MVRWTNSCSSVRPFFRCLKLGEMINFFNRNRDQGVWFVGFRTSNWSWIADLNCAGARSGESSEASSAVHQNPQKNPHEGSVQYKKTKKKKRKKHGKNDFKCWVAYMIIHSSLWHPNFPNFQNCFAGVAGLRGQSGWNGTGWVVFLSPTL